MTQVKRYRGEPLRPGSRIAVFANDALGNFVVCTPLLQKLREAHNPSCLHFFGGARTEELRARSELIDKHFAWCGMPLATVAQYVSGEKPYDLVVNIESTAEAKAAAAIACADSTLICGPCLAPDGVSDFALAHDDRGRLQGDPDWTAVDLTSRYPFLQTPFISEIFSRLAYLEGPIPLYSVPCSQPDRGIPDILVAASASLPEKLWPSQKWIEVLTRLKRAGLSVGLLGADPETQLQFWKGAGDEQDWVDAGLVEDLRGKFTLPQVVGALEKAKVVVTLDNGILHLAAATGANIVGLYRDGIHRLWAPPVAGLAVLTAGEGKPVSGIGVEEVWEAVEGVV